MLKRLPIIIAILACCIGCDQSTKSIAKSHLSETQVISLLGDSVRLQIAENYGAFLSLGASKSPAVRSALFSVGVAAMLLALLVYSLRTMTKSPVVVPAVALIIGGGVSNLLDRLMYGGYVVDFLNLGVGSIRTGIFNVADVFIMCGVLGLTCSDLLLKMVAARSAAN
jgi:signal peptidase II